MSRFSVNCFKCKYYAQTWEPKFPHSCRLLEFKSRTLPSAVAFDSTGAVCVGFEPKKAPKADGGGKVIGDGAVIVNIRGR